MALWHAKNVLGYLEVEYAHGRLTGQALRATMRGLFSVFPEATNDRMAWKLWVSSVVGTGWLRALRKATGRPDPYASPLALFNSFT